MVMLNNKCTIGARSALLSVCLFWVGIAPPVQAVENTSVLAADFISVPTISTPSAAPLVMLGMSVDHQLFVKAYSDYSDLDGDGIIDTTYLDRFDYYGYFNSDWCYSYGGSYFSPDNTAAGANGHTCNGSTQWSGNFLNWAAMTRIDVVRKVLYGGKRSTDNTTAPQTILERANLPPDVHAFAKVWDDNGRAFTPFNQAITLCNVSTSATGAPLIRVAKGDWHFWSATELKQCQWGPKATEPVEATDKLAEYNARVEVCKAGKDDGAAACRNYGTSKKPAGLLQRFGEQGELEFGLISGSYENKIKGGTLRKNISKIADPATTPPNILTVDEINLSTGQFTGVNGIISTINAFRISGYDYSASRYGDCSTHSITVNTFKTSTASDRQCRDWGNPLGEIYLEALRYFAGNTTPSTGFNANDSAIISGLANSPAWVDPMTADEKCANCAIILLSTGLNSFDQDQLASASDIPGLTGAATVNSKTDTVGKIEISGSASGSFSGTYLANGGVGIDRYCSAKTLTNLSDVKGVCPEVPNLEGGYQVAGLAYHGHIEDLRTAAGYDDDQTVETYTMALAESLPSFTVPVGGGSVNFLPTCESNTSSAAFADPNWQSCSLFDVKVEKLITDATTGKVVYGRYLFFWEDSLWGNDYDIDAIQRIEFCVGTFCNSNPIPTSSVAASAADPLALPLQGRFENSSAYADGGTPSPSMSSDEIMIVSSLPHVQAGNRIRASYSVSGITPQPSATPPLANGILTGTATDPKWSTKASGSYSCIFTGLGTCDTTNEPPRRTTRFAASTSSPAAALLNNPLYYAAKFGNFNDLDGDDTPLYQGNVADTREWDVRDVDGNLSPDGLPDSFFPVSNPASLESSLTRVLTNIIDRTASGTAAAVVANNTTGEGAIYQALYNPVINDELGNTVNWVGQLQAIFIDAQGNLREDADQDGVLDSCAIDPAIEVFFDTNANETRIRRYAHATCDKLAATATITVDDLENLGTIWDAREQLSVIADPTQQRVYTAQVNGTSAAGGRHIFTSLGGSAVAFEAATVSASNYNYWNTANAIEAQKVVNFIRGDNTIPGLRKRSVDYDGDGNVDIWRLGDIVHSTPVVAGQPRESHAQNYTDVSYASFQAAYKDRRQMVYVGANDGMVHAFNGGFWDPVTSAFKANNGTAVAHPLGAEIWAYVPFNLLPHLKWQTEVDYEHVYYVDGAPKIHDVNIFTPDSTHVEGWGTILVVGMRFGGTPVTVDADDNGIGVGTDETLRSAYMIFDVTDPELPPVLLAEITDPNLGLTTGVPTIVKERLPVAGAGFTAASVDSWILAFGSGPTDLATTTSTQNARLYAYDLVARALVSGFAPLVLSEANSFVGSLTSVDWDLDYLDDAVYFGIAGGSAAAATGKIKRVRLDASPWTVADFFVPPSGQPFISAPEAVKDGKGQQWIFAGTGRYYVTGDTGTTEQQAFYGIKDPLNIPASRDLVSVGSPAIATPVALTQSSLLNTTDIRVFTNAEITDTSGSPVVIASVTIPTFGALVSVVDQDFSGWFNNLDLTGPSTRNVNEPARVSNLVLWTEFSPANSSSCDAGDSFLRVKHFNTGTAAPFSPVGTNPSIVHNSADMVLTGVALGPGLSSAPIIHSGSGGITVITQGSTGAIGGDIVTLQPSQPGRQSWRQIFDF